MPRYFFHLRNQHETIDEEGCDFADEEAARREGLASARELLADAIRLGRNFPPEQIVIADASGHEVATISLKDVLPTYLLD
jgi:hypothetical protein